VVIHELQIDGEGEGRPRLILAHGAGAPMDSEFMNLVATGLAAHGLAVVRFEFPYMASRRQGGGRRPPDPTRRLLQTFEEVIAQVGPAGRLVIGGKSLGGRVASMIADAAEVLGLVCLGYPFHPPGRPDRLRIEHLGPLKTPALFVQGERDPFGGCSEVEGYPLSERIRFHWLADGDHSFKPRVRSGHTLTAHLDSCVETVAGFVREVQA
jgi:predicted alpha/beta-hydrolase family hydrolase